ncbi:MAG: VCBS repeat-containing protein, partial [Deltaproteobacteria bacterium]|nr:VCBS repeat-containing protein [Deltaproteobacteria bacterium]
MRYAWTGEKFEASEVVALETRHMKEILVADIDGDGKQELYAAIEAEIGGRGKIKQPVEIRRFDWKDGKFEATTVTEIADRLCRFLVAGDIDGDGKNELIAAAFSAGVWVIEHDG